ncbi:MAG: carbohydrate kinase family protein [Anaerolineaceae bacterium]
MNSGKNFDVVIVGEVNVDLILKGNIDPVFGQVEKIIEQASLTIGSSAAIFACGAARLGLRTAFIGMAGDDAFGRFMVEALNSHGIDTAGIKIKPELDTGVSVILAKGADRAILTYPGSIPELKYSDIDFSIISQASHLHLSSFFLLDNLRPDIPRLFQQAREMGLSTSLDTNYDPREEWGGNFGKTIAFTDILMPNSVELAAIAGEENLERAIAKLSEKIPYVVVKLGAKGAIAKKNAENAIRQDAISIDVVDTVGAGDSFDAGFLYGFLKGMNISQSLKMAVACGSLSTRGSGGTSAQPDLKEALDFANLLK